MIGEVKDRNAKFTWEIIGIYRAPNEDIWFIERLAARTYSLGKSKKRNIIGADLNLSYTDRKGKADVTSGGQTCINRLVWENGYAQLVRWNPRGCIAGCLPCPARKFNSWTIEQTISDHCGVLEHYRRTEVERLVAV
jgi:hypothetical protein